MQAALAILVLLAAQSEEARDRARAHFEAGREHHQLGRFDEAIIEYEAAYQLVPLPDILFNIGQCHRNLQNEERAIFFFERFLQEAPSAQDAELVKKLVAELEEELAKKKPAETATIAATPPPPPPEIVPPPIDEEEGVHRQWWFWTIIAVGVAAAAGGTAFALTRQEEVPAGTIGTIDLR